MYEKYPTLHKKLAYCLLTMFLIILNTGCGFIQDKDQITQQTNPDIDADYEYIIGPGDQLQIFIWRNPDLSSANALIPVRPDGRISSPLVEDMVASGKTSTQLARDIEKVLAQYIKEPLVTVTVMGFVGGFQQQIRVVGEAVTLRALPYRSNMSILDVMIEVGGLTEFAAGNKATIVRHVNGGQKQIRVRLEDLLKGGDISANIQMFPGDIVVIPESLF